jgi:dihydrodipicolinate synthase/N-acetylneuraminate lyase
MLLEGLQLPLTTPFYPDGRLNLLKLEHNVARYSKTPAAGLAVLSDCGEPTMLSDDETHQVLQSVAAAASAEKVLATGVSRDSVVGTLELAEYAATFGYDAVLVKTPSVFREGAQDATKELLNYFRAVADRSPLPLVLCSGDQRQSDWLPTEMIVELAGHPQIIGLIDGAGGRERVEAIREGTDAVSREVTVTAVFAAVTRRMQAQNMAVAQELIAANTLTTGATALAIAPAKTSAKTRTKAVGFQILAGSAARMLEGLLGGAVGAMPAFAAAAPQACYEALAAWKDGDERLAQEKQARLRKVAELMEELGVAGIKFGGDLNGYFGGRCRLPLLPLTGEERAEVEALMQGLRH